ncbi:cellulose biosynthesis protein BcsQ [Nocardioides zeae]|uniref:Cellulose biosynthesis protein BcsQ n=1 Tax=Nocardioides zeae TaxID=1457234 RepID=A0ACC6IFV4_9ACTN|nr:ParA family protein [Nocardioides zeae]MDR6176542.1 cellulose biosynthesis protein BcsQ [Nocardioides zeae]MDR6209554.1 cellulose biosynthesis protein BcsQ [Nocardioides zeae]
MQSIAVFNNKGGVGKTTLLCNLAAHLSLKHGKSVLVVDADPQCNATQSLFADDDVESFYAKNSFTIQSIVRPLSRGRGFAKDVKVHTSESFGLDVLVGDPDLGLTEDLLATDWVQGTAGDVRGLRTTLLFTQLLQRFNKYDFVFFDMGPSLGSINRAVLLSCDYFITPMSLDIFSLKAIENIAKSLDNWKFRYSRGLESVDDPADELEVENPAWDLKFAGYVTQQYTFKRDAEGEMRPVKAFERIMRRVPEVVDENLGASAVKSDDLHLGSIPTLHSLVPLSQTSRKPIFALQGVDGVVGAHFSKVRDFERIISGISTRLLQSVGAS